MTNLNEENEKKRRQARNQGGARDAFAPPPQVPKVHILILNVQAKEYSRLN